MAIKLFFEVILMQMLNILSRGMCKNISQLFSTLSLRFRLSSFLENYLPVCSARTNQSAGSGWSTQSGLPQLQTDSTYLSRTANTQPFTLLGRLPGPTHSATSKPLGNGPSLVKLGGSSTKPFLVWGIKQVFKAITSRFQVYSWGGNQRTSC